MRVNELPSAEVLRQLLEYDPETGALRWLPRPVELFSPSGKRTAQVICDVWNKRYAGRVALNQPHAAGYRNGKLLGGTFMAHRVAWKIATGLEPEFIDHINGDKSDNRLANLRSVTWLENTKNRPRPKNNASGQVGVWWYARAKRWRAQIRTPNSPCQYLGQFETFEEAVLARKAAEVEYGYHENHGR